MIVLETKISNEGARAALRELRAFLARSMVKATRERPHPTAAKAYVILQDIHDRLEARIADQDARRG